MEPEMSPKTPKICHITVGHHPLDDRIFYKELLSLVKVYRSVTLVAPRRERLSERDGVQFRLFPEAGFFRSLIRAYRMAKTVRADLYHVHEFEFLPLALLLKYKYGKKIIYDAHETIYFYFTEFTRHARWISTLPALFAQVLEWFCAHFVDHVVTVTPWVARGFGPFQKKITLIYNFPRIGLFPAMRKTVDRSVILYHGQLVAARNIDRMVAAMKTVKPKFPNAKLLLVGNIQPDYRATLQAIIDRDQLNDMVEFRPAVPYTEIPELLQEAGIGLSSMSPNESFRRSIQIKPFEFMIAAVPVLGCRVPSTEFFIEKVGCGRLIDPPTAQRLGETICELLADPQEMQAMGERGQKAVQQRFYWQRMEKRLLKLYRNLLLC